MDKETRVREVSEAIRNAMNDAFGIDGYDVTVFIDMNNGKFEADIPSGTSMGADGFVEIAGGYEYYINGNLYIVRLNRYENNNLYFDVEWEL